MVTLTAFNDCGLHIFSDTVIIITIPSADFTADPVNGCLPMAVTFTDASSPNTTTWNWNFPGGNRSFSTLQNPNVTYEEAGLYPVSLTASNAAGQHQVPS